MIEHIIKKLENPLRISELNPHNMLIRAGLKQNMTLCDIGAGTGLFTFQAAKITNKDIYALDISDKMLELLKEKIKENNIENIKLKKVISDDLPLDNDSCDMVIMVTVLHEVSDKEKMIKEINRVLKKDGKLMIIEFHKKETPMGPPVEHRLSEEYVESLCLDCGFKDIVKDSLGDNFYSIIADC